MLWHTSEKLEHFYNNDSAYRQHSDYTDTAVNHLEAIYIVSVRLPDRRYAEAVDDHQLHADDDVIQ
jgi:hypothetical protein